jgi:hypothetical protein
MDPEEEKNRKWKLNPEHISDNVLAGRHILERGLHKTVLEELR